MLLKDFMKDCNAGKSTESIRKSFISLTEVAGKMSQALNAAMGIMIYVLSQSSPCWKRHYDRVLKEHEEKERQIAMDKLERDPK